MLKALRAFFAFVLILGSLAVLAKKDKKLDKPDAPKSVLFEQIILEDEHLGEFKSSLFNQETNKEPALVFKPGKIIELIDVLTLVKDNHPDIASAKLSRQIAYSKRLEAQGAFDPSINSENFFRRFNSSSDPGEAQEAFTSNTSLDFLTGYGAKLGLGANFSKGDIKTPVKPTGEAGEYFLKASVPLLRGAIYNSANVQEKTAKLNEIIADFKLFRTKLKTLSAASNAYWDWVSAKQVYDIENNLLQLVNGQVAFVDDQAELGNLPKISVVEAEREVQKRQAKVSESLRKLQKESIKLSSYTWTSNGTPYAIPLAEQAPINNEEPTELNDKDVQIAKERALANRPELKALGLMRDVSDLERKLAKNQMLPKLDAYLGSGFQAGDDSVSPTVMAGVDMSIPLRVRKAKGKKQQAELKIQKFNLQERQLVQSIFLEVEDAASEVITSYLKYLAAKQDYELSYKLEQGEKQRFELGDSTLFLVIRRQRATVAANTDLINTTALYQKAKIRFKLIQAELI